MLRTLMQGLNEKDMQAVIHTNLQPKRKRSFSRRNQSFRRSFGAKYNTRQAKYPREKNAIT